MPRRAVHLARLEGVLSEAVNAAAAAQPTEPLAFVGAHLLGTEPPPGNAPPDGAEPQLSEADVGKMEAAITEALNAAVGMATSEDVAQLVGEHLMAAAATEREERRAAAAAQYTEPAAVFAAVRSGDVLLLKSEWVMQRGGYDKEEDNKKGLIWVLRREAQPLPCRQEIEEHHPEAIMSADELERLYSQLVRKERNYGFHYSLLERKERDDKDIPIDALPVVSVSHCWETRDEPDPEGRTLRTVTNKLAGTWNRWGQLTGGLPLYAAWGFEQVGIFFDFASLYQNKPVPRTPEQDECFTRALGGMSIW